jgi:hypothetical protein
MIEGINASIASAALARPAVDQLERVASYAANPSQVQRVAQAPYLSLYIAMNYNIDKAVLQIRDAESAEVLAQIPSDAQIKAYRKAAQNQPAIFEAKADSAEKARDVVVPTAAPTQETAPIIVNNGGSVEDTSSGGSTSGEATTGTGTAQTSPSVLITA